MLEKFTCRIPKNGVTLDYTDSGDDGSTKEYRLMWLNDEDSAKKCVLSLPNVLPLIDEDLDFSRSFFCRGL